MGRVRVLPSGRRDAGPEITRVGLFQSFRRFGVRAMTQAEVDGCRRLPRRLSALPVIRQAAGWAFGVVVPLVAIGPATLNHELIGLPTEVVLLFLATVGGGTRWWARPGVAGRSGRRVTRLLRPSDLHARYLRARKASRSSR
jgi:hypothetical protein